MNPRDLFSELRRRRVFRVAGMYAAGAFIIAQVADIFFPGLGLPAGSLRLVLVLLVAGFPVALILAWAFDITPDGVTRADPPISSTPLSNAADGTGGETQPVIRQARRRVSALVAALLVALVAAGAYSVVNGRQDAAPSADVSLTAVAVFPFSIRGSAESEYLGEGMVDLLSAKLDGVGALRAVDPRALLSFIAREGGNSPDPARGRVLAEQFGAGLFILGNILEVGGRLQLSATLYSHDLGARPVSTRVEGEAERIWELVDRLAAQLLAEQLGRGERLTRLATTTTESFPALRAYLDGESAVRVGDFPAARDAYQRALTADSTFALAHYRLAMSAAWSFDPILSRAAIERALRHADRLSERDRRLVTAFLMYDEGRAAEAETIYRTLVASYPDDVEAWYQLGETLVHHNAFRGRSWHEARDAFGRAVALQPDHELSITHLMLLDMEEARSADAASHHAALDPDGAFHAAYSPVVWLLGDQTDRARALDALRQAPDGVVQVVAWLAQVGRSTYDVAPDVARLLTEPSRSAATRAAGHLLLAQIEAGQGRQRASADALRAARSLDAAAAVEIRALVALSPVLHVERAELEALRTELERQDVQGSPALVAAQDAIRPQLRLYLLGLLNARLGDDAAARRHAAELERTDGPASAGTLMTDLALAVAAEIALARGAAAEALAILERARLEMPYNSAITSPFFFQDRQRFLRAELLNQTGRTEEAIGWYTAVAETSPAYAAIAHLRLGEVHDDLGNHEQAVQHYARFVAVWHDCDAGLCPQRKAAERRLVALHTATGQE